MRVPDIEANIERTISTIEQTGSIEANRERIYDDDGVVLLLDGVIMGPMTIYGFEDTKGAMNPYIYNVVRTDRDDDLETDYFVVSGYGPPRRRIETAIEDVGGRVE